MWDPLPLLGPDAEVARTKLAVSLSEMVKSSRRKEIPTATLGFVFVQLVDQDLRTGAK